MKVFSLVVILILSSCATQKHLVSNEPVTQSPTESEKLLSRGYKELISGERIDAITYFDQVITLCEKRYEGSDKQVYAARHATESLYYMLKSMADNQAAIAVSPTCGDALYFKAYANIELGQLDIAEKHLNKAIKLSPVNSMYLSELGHIYQVKKNWQKALSFFSEAEKGAETYSPEELKQQELTRAKRGMGFNLIELGKLNEAEIKFRECLEIDRNDQSAKQEIKYIKNLRKNKQNTLP